VLTLALATPASTSLRTSSTLRIPPPTVSGTGTSAATARITSTVVSCSSADAVTSSNVTSSAPAATYALASSTGSPASRSPVKFTPLTTRPASRSRHGITRTPSDMVAEYRPPGQLCLLPTNPCWPVMQPCSPSTTPQHGTAGPESTCLLGR